MRAARHRLLRDRGAVVGAALALALVVIAIGAPWLAGDPFARDLDHGLTELGAPLGPSRAAPLGTDHVGRDVWARLAAGAGTSLAIAGLATVLALALGLAVGLAAGLAGGRTDEVLMRAVDLVLAFPVLLLAILLAALLRESGLGASSAPVVVTLAAVGWTTTARVIRGQTRVLAAGDMVLAARALGASGWRIVTRHVLPNAAGLVLALTALAFAQNLLAESVLSYLGLGPPPPEPTWGRMLHEGRAYYRIAPHLVLAPGAAIVLAVAAFHLLGNGLRAAVEPPGPPGPPGRRRGGRVSRPRAAAAAVAAAAIAAAVALAACDPPSGPRWRAAGATSPRVGGTLRFATSADVHTLDPAIAYDDATTYALQPVLDTLVDYDAGTRLVPRLAERWVVSADGLTYRFWLRPGLRYADGAPIVAADFAFALHRALRTPDSPFGAFLADVAGAADVLAGTAARAAGITVAGERELAIRLDRPNAAFLYVLAMKFTAPLTAAYAEAAGADLRRRPLASGPYQVRSWDEGRALVLERRPNYHDPTRQRLDAIVLLESVPRDVQFLMFERGQLDTVDRLAAPDQQWIASQPAWAPYVRAQPLMNAFGARMNVTVPPFDDRRVRQAFNYALDKRHVVKLLAGTAVPAHGLLGPGVFGRADDLAPYPHDPAKARALLAEAGHAGGLRVPFVTIADEEAEKLAVSMQADLAAVGVTLDLRVMSFAAWVSVVGSPSGPPFSIGTWVADFPDPTGFLDPKFHSRAIGSSNDSFYANRELDALLDRARAEADPRRRRALYARAEHILYDDAPWVWSYHQLATEVTQPYVRGYAPHPIWGHDFTTAWLDLGPDGEPVPR